MLILVEDHSVGGSLIHLHELLFVGRFILVVFVIEYVGICGLARGLLVRVRTGLADEVAKPAKVRKSCRTDRDREYSLVI